MKRNLKELAFQVLEQAKADLARDKHLIPVGYVITDTKYRISR